VKARSVDIKRFKSTSLNYQIKHTERQLQNRQQRVDTASQTLTNSIHRQMTAPASLWLAGGSGFIISELTNSQTAATSASASKDVETPLMTLINFISLLRTALPLVWMFKSFYLADQNNDEGQN
jgi:hypothetical protein